ncbi:DPOM polymerase, partial [Polypterus senegalus]
MEELNSCELSSKNAPVNSLFCKNEKDNLSKQVKIEIKEEDGSVDIGLGIPKKITMSPKDELLKFKQKHLGAMCCPVVVGHTSPQCQNQVLTQKLKQESVADDALNNGLVPPQTVLESLVQELQKVKWDQIKQIRANAGLNIHVENEAIAGSFEPSQHDQCKSHVICNLDDSGVMTNNIFSTHTNKREHLIRPGDIKVENESGEDTECLRGPSPATVCPVLQSSVKIEPQNFQGSTAEIETKVPDTLYFSASLKCSQNQSLQHEGKNESVMNESSNLEGTTAQPGMDSLVLHAKEAQHSGQGKQKCEHISLNTSADEEISSAHNGHNVQCNSNLYNKETLNDSKIQTNVIYTPLSFDNEKEQQYSLGSVKIKQENECVAVSSEIPNPGPTTPMSDLYLQGEQQKWQPIVDMNKKNILHPQQHQRDISFANIKRKKCVTNDATLSSDLLTSYEQQNNVHLSQEDGKIIKKGSSTLSTPLLAKEESTNKSVLEVRSDKQMLNVGSGSSFQHPMDPGFNKANLHIQRRAGPFFQNREFCCNFNFKSLAFLKSFSHLYLAIHQVFQEVLDHAKPDLKGDDYVQLDLCAESHKDSMITQGHAADLNVSTFLNKVADKLPATKDILACENLSLILKTVSNLKGESGISSKPNYVLPYNILRQKRRCMFILNNQGNNLCFAATLIGLMDLKNARIDKIMKEAVELHKQLNLPPQDMVSFSNIAKFEELLDIKIKVYYGAPDLQVFETSTAPHPRTYFMYLQNNHYYGITSLTSFLGVKQICRLCHRPTMNNHKCNAICKVCLSSNCQQVKNERVSCKDCYRTCKSRLCYIRHKLLQSDEKHQKPTPSPCDSVIHCRECRNPINLTPGVKAHQCQMVTCHGCGERSRDEKHRCFLSELKPEPLTSNYIFFDIICRAGRVPCYIYALSIDSTVEKAFYGNDCIARFCTFFIKSRFEGYTFLAHNCKNFDGDLILNFLVQNHMKCEYFNLGTSFKGFIVLLTKIRFINTYCFMPMKLRAMPKAFGFKMSRGYFPHYFNTPVNENYCGPVPSIQSYGQRHLVGEESSCFLKWHKIRRSTGFNFLSEMKQYCKNSVDMLLQAFLCFRNVFSDGKDIDPFKFKNIGNAAMALFRTNFFPKNTIPIIPFDIYRREYRYFQAANIQWLEYVSAAEGIKIQHALNAGEKQFGPYFVDGFATIDGEDICFLYCACSTYGCPECLKNISRRSCAGYSKKYEDLQEKISYLKGRNLQIRIMWEHEWLELKQEPKMRPFLKKYPDPFDPWNSIYGNRAEAICLLYKIQPDEKIKYFVFNDLLMYVYKTKSFPAGHPVIIREDFDDLSEYFGFAKVTIFPPKKLLFPVLGTCLNGHILFSLCRTCAEMKQTAICTHEDEQRSLTGIWSTVELSKALECGYRVGKVFEVWHFEKRSTKLFESYIKRNMKIKQEAQGFPHWCNNDEQKDLYVKKYFDEEGVKLERDNIKMNQGSHKVSSLLLDSLWEEFGSSAVNFRSSIVTTSEELDKLIFSKYFSVLNVDFFNDTTAYVQWHYDSDTKKFPTNIFLASFVSAYVHLELYSVLENLQERCLYFDTDTIVFVSRPGSWEPPLSTKLGGFSSRIKNEDHIVEFVSATHKTYGYKTFKGEAYMKVKGFAFEHASSDQVNLASIIDLVKTDLFKLGPDSNNTIQNMTKGVQPDFNIVFDKRVLNSDHFTLPYGF